MPTQEIKQEFSENTNDVKTSIKSEMEMLADLKKN